MKSISFYVQKGGTGKTSMTGNVSRALAEFGSVLMVDGDPQGNLTGWFYPHEIEFDLTDVLKGTATVQQAVLSVHETFPLYLMPTIAAGGELKPWSETTLPSKPFIFHDFMESLTSFDYVVWDMSPGHSLLEKSILASVHELVAVIGPESFSVDGLELLSESIQLLRKDRRARIGFKRIIVNRLNRSYAMQTAYHERLQSLPYQIYTVGQSTGIHDSVPSHLAGMDYDSKNRNIETLWTIAKDLS